jgi:hypothetical protein
MESKVAKEAERALVEATQCLSPEERLNAFLAHCRLVMELYEAGQKARSQAAQPQPWERRDQVSTVRFIGREDFIAMKVFAGGPMDLVDAARAVTAAGSSLDLELVRRLAKGFGRAASKSLERRRGAQSRAGARS